MMGAAQQESTTARESYFAAYATSIKRKTKVPIMLTGGMRTRVGMQAALAGGVCDVIGLGRPMCVSSDVPARLLSGAMEAIARDEDTVSPRKALGPWFCLQLIHLARGVPVDFSLSGADAIAQYTDYENRMAAAVAPTVARAGG